MAARDAKPAALAAVKRARATVEKCDGQAVDARAAFRRALVSARQAGVSNVELARELGTSESRVRQDIARGLAES
jgi:DNA-directed RNA polymerase specialized sigma24 family protein